MLKVFNSAGLMWCWSILIQPDVGNDVFNGNEILRVVDVCFIFVFVCFQIRLRC